MVAFPARKQGVSQADRAGPVRARRMDRPEARTGPLAAEAHTDYTRQDLPEPEVAGHMEAKMDCSVHKPEGASPAVALDCSVHRPWEAQRAAVPAELVPSSGYSVHRMEASQAAAPAELVPSSDCSVHRMEASRVAEVADHMEVDPQVAGPERAAALEAEAPIGWDHRT